MQYGHWIVIAGLAFGGFSLAACEDDGPAEEVGEEIDDAAEELD